MTIVGVALLVVFVSALLGVDTLGGFYDEKAAYVDKAGNVYSGGALNTVRSGQVFLLDIAMIIVSLVMIVLGVAMSQVLHIFGWILKAILPAGALSYHIKESFPDKPIFDLKSGPEPPNKP